VQDGHQHDGDRLAEVQVVAAGAIRPLVSERLPLADVPYGLRRLADGVTTGRVVFLP
jgi:NADPH2:quinone reductase